MSDFPRGVISTLFLGTLLFLLYCVPLFTSTVLNCPVVAGLGLAN